MLEQRLAPAITLVQTIGQEVSYFTDTIAITPTSTVISGDSIIITLAIDTAAGSGGAITVTDSTSNTNTPNSYTVDADTGGGGPVRAVVISAHNIVHLPDQFGPLIIQFAAPVFAVAVSASEYAGLGPDPAVVTAFDQSATGIGGGTAVSTGVTAATVQNDELLVAAVGFTGANTDTFTPGAPLQPFSPGYGAMTSTYADYGGGTFGLHLTPESTVVATRSLEDINNNGIFDAGDDNTDADNTLQFGFLANGTLLGNPWGAALATYKATSVVRGEVFQDITLPLGTKDATDPGLDGWTIQEYSDNNQNGIVDGGDVLDATTTTDEFGNYYFKDNINALGPFNLYIDDVVANEGNTGATTFAFKVHLNRPSATPVTVNFATSDGTATSGSGDYVAIPLTGLTFSPGQIVKTVNVTVNGDLTTEADERFNVNLSGAVGAAIADPTGVGTILNDDGVQIFIDDQMQAEGNAGTTTMTFNVSLNVPSPVTVTVAYATGGGTATGGVDYVSTAGTLTFAPGVTTAQIPVTIQGDATAETTEFFNVTLSAPTNATLADAVGRGIILDDDAGEASQFYVENMTAAEGATGTSNMAFTIGLSNPTAGGTVNISTGGGTATAGVDYTAVPLTTIGFAIGQFTAAQAVSVNGDLTVEANETYNLTLAAIGGQPPVNGGFGVGVGTIVNDDGPLALRIDDVSKSEGNTGTTDFVFTVSLTFPNTTTVTVNYNTVAGTATAGVDYVDIPLNPPTTTLTFAPGTTTQTITVTVNGDTTFEPNETFSVFLSGATGGATIADATGAGTIVNDDLAPLIFTATPPAGELQWATTTAPDPLLSPVVLIDNASEFDGRDFGRRWDWLAGTDSFISGQKFEDLDGDGVKDPGEPGLDGWTMNLYQDTDLSGGFSTGDTLIATTVTAFANGMDGYFKFGPAAGVTTGAADSKFFVVEQLQVGWTQTMPYNPVTYYTLDATGGAVYVANADFGNFKNIDIFGTKIDLSGGDGNNWTIFLDLNNNGVLDPGEPSTITASEDLNNDGILNPSEDTNFNNRLDPGEDLNGNGILDYGEDLNNNGFIDTGVYHFFNLGPNPLGPGPNTTGAKYHVAEVQKAGFGQVLPSTEDGNGVMFGPATNGIRDLSEDGDLFFFGLGPNNNGFFDDFNFLAASNFAVTVNFFNDLIVPPATITGSKYEDVNGNGALDNGVDRPLEGWTIQLWQDNSPFGIGVPDGIFEPFIDSVVATTTTNAAGAYGFVVRPGAYFIREVQQPGWTMTQGDYYVTPGSGETSQGNDFGNFHNVTVSGRKFEDLNGNGLDDGRAEPGLAGWTINLYKDNDSVQIFTSDVLQAEGNAGTSTMTFTVSLNVASAQTVTVNWATGDPGGPAGASAAEPDYTAGAGTLTFAPGTTTQTFNVTIQGDVTPEPTEFFTVTLSAATNAKIASPTASGIILDDDGGEASQFYVGNVGSAEGSAGPTTMTFTIGLSNPAAGGSVNIFTSDGTAFAAEPDYTAVPLTPKVFAPGQFTATQAVTLNGDTAVEPNETFNLNLVPIGGQPPVNGGFSSGVGTIVNDDGVGLLNIGTDSLVGSAATDALGNYSFSQVENGRFFVQEVPQGGWTATRPTAPDYFSFDTVSGVDVSATSGTKYHDTEGGVGDGILDPSEAVTDINFGNTQPVTISGRKFNDLNQDGTDNGRLDPPLSGWEIDLIFDANFNGLNDDPVTLSALTDANGFYAFRDIVLTGTYFVQEVPQAGWVQTKPGPPGYYTAVIAAINPANNAANLDFGNFEQGSISGKKFEDSNGNGAEDLGESGLSGWNILLYEDTDLSGGFSTGDTLISSSTTLGAPTPGDYSFTGLNAGRYFVFEEAQGGWIGTFPATAFYTVDIFSGTNLTNLDFGNFKKILISGLKYDDLNGNGVQDFGEPGLSGWTIFLDTNNNGVLDSGEPFTVTAADDPLTVPDETGQYSFLDLPPGLYHVREVLQVGWTQTQPGAPLNGYDLQAFSGFDWFNRDFGNVQPITVTISGEKFEDHNGNGTLDVATDQGLTGWTINLYQDTNNNGIYDPGVDQLAPATVTATNTVVTPAGGFYTFTIQGALPAVTGVYFVREAQQAGWTMTKGDYTVTISNLGVVTATGGASVSGTDVAGADFGNFQNITVAGRKFEDLNADGTDDGGTDPGLSGWTIDLWRDNGDGLFDPLTDILVGSAVTDFLGKYSFPNRGPGTYFVQESIPIAVPAWVQTLPGTGIYTINPAQSAVNLLAENFGNYQPSTISGRKFDDRNGNGNDNSGADPGLVGWQIQLYHDNGDGIFTGADLLFANTTTDANGFYSFRGLTVFGPGGGRYYVREVVQAGWQQTRPTPTTYYTVNVTGLPGDVHPGDDFGNFHKITISGQKFEDHNGNGIKDPGDQGLSGWTINIYRDNDGSGGLTPGDGPPVSVLVTNGTGNYTSPLLGPGLYFVREVPQAGWTPTAAVAGYNLVASSGLNYTNQDFGNFKLFSISGEKFNDLNGNGVKDGGEPGLDGWTIFLDTNNNGVLDGGEPNVVTAGGGLYSFTNLGPGTYNVREVIPVPPPIWIQTLAPAPIVGASGVNVINADFGNSQAVTVNISGQKFEDHNGNGIDDGVGDQGLPGWTIQLWKDANGNGFLDGGDTLYATTITNASGLYNFNFSGLLGTVGGTYFLTEVLQVGWTNTRSPVAAIVVVGNTTSVGNDFGNFQNIGISGRKFEDLDGNGNDNTGTDPGLSGWTIRLWRDANANSVLDGGDTLVATVATNVIGQYQFTNVVPGTYFVDEDLAAQPGWVQTLPGPPVASPGPSNYYTINPAMSGVNISGDDFGNKDPVTISGRKFNDLNGNGVRDASEPLLSGWTIHLYNDVNDSGTIDGGDILLLTTTTDSAGLYRFRGLGAGNYLVSEVLQAGWVQSSPTPVPPGLWDVDITAGNVASGSMFANRDFGNIKLPIISGVKFNDINGNGTLDVGEPGLNGWTILLYGDTDGSGGFSAADTVVSSTVTATVSGVDGFYSFTVTPGLYFVREQLQSGWSQTTLPVWYTINAISGVNDPNRDFGNFQHINISGFKFDDLNGDGTDNGGTDPRLAGWVIYLDLNNNGVLGPGEPSVTTGNGLTDVDGDGVIDPLGFYGFRDLGPGTYNVREVLQAGWAQTVAPAPIVATSGTNATNQDFGNFHLFNLSGRKFNDLNGNGNDNGGSDPGLGGWTIYVDLNNNRVFDPGEPSTVTGPTGTYSLSLVLSGTFWVREVPQAPWTQTYGDQPLVHLVTFSSGGSASGVDFGNFERISASGLKFEDLDGNGVQGATEPGLAGWTIQLWRDDDLNGILSGGDTLHASVLTDFFGNYSFTDINPGRYFVTEILKAGWTQTRPGLPFAAPPGYYTFDAVSGTDISATSGFKFIDRNTDGLYDADGLDNVLGTADDEATTNVDFGNVQPIVISGLKFEDHDGNGVQDPGDQGLQGWTIRLYTDTDASGTFTAADALVATAITDANGIYAFRGLPAGTYFVAELLQAGWTETFPDALTPLPATGAPPPPFAGLGPFYYKEVVAPGAIVSQQNFGNFQTITISGRKFNDQDGNGNDNGGTDPGLPGWTIQLWQDFDGDGLLNTAVDTLVTTQVTGVGGAYSFTNLGPGTYFLTEVPQVSWFMTRPVTPPGYYTVVASSGVPVPGEDFGNTQLFIGGEKFEDHNGNGVKNGGDLGLPGWTIEIFADTNADGVLDGGDALVSSAVTDPFGNYGFTGIAPGSYFVAEVLLAGWTQTAPVPGVISPTVSVPVATAAPPLGPHYYHITVLPATPITGLDFGNFDNVTLSGEKFEDHNGNGVKDAGDQGLQLWTIELYRDANGNGTLEIGTDTFIASTLTDPVGNYTFTNVGPGTFFIHEVLQSGWTQTAPTPVPPGIYTIVTSSGVDVAGLDIGNFHNFSITGEKFEDHNGNGVKDAGDQGLQGWTIQLWRDGGNGIANFGPDDTLVQTTTTDFNGNYRFLNVGPGNFWVRELTQAGWVQTFPMAPTYYSIVGSSGVNVTDDDFGNFKEVTISGRKIEDLNGNGIFDGGEPGLNGWTIFIDTNNNGILDGGELSTVTATVGGVVGVYSFLLGPSSGGLYHVREVLQAGWTQTFGNYDIPALSGQDAVNKNFGNFKLITISGTKYNDLNGNGIKDIGEPGIDGVTIYLDLNGNTKLDFAEPSTVTAGGGLYSFTGLGPRADVNYTVRELLTSLPPPGSQWFNTSGDYHIAAISGTVATSKDFGNFLLTSGTAQILNDPCDDKSLVIMGTAANDNISAKTDKLGNVTVTVNKVNLGTFSGISRIIAYGLAGNDSIKISTKTLVAELYGGDGNDTLAGGSFNNILVGGNGNDILKGGSGRDILIGGLGADNIRGSSGDDILIAGNTSHDTNHTALCLALHEWTSARDYGTRIDNLNNRFRGSVHLNEGVFFLGGVTVFDDISVDTLSGGSGLDWFFATKGVDIITDLAADEFVG